jgi:Mn2+/Fe2+ NRAMP family transporter
LFGFIMGVAVLIILITGAPLIAITIWSQVLNAVMLPAVLIFMIKMVNNPKIMGTHVNNRFQNVVGWSSTTILIVLTAILLVTQLVEILVK